MTQNLIQKISDLTQEYVRPKELVTDLVGIGLLAATYDYLGAGMDNFLPNIANAAGTYVASMYFLKGEEEPDRFSRSVYAAISIVGAATLTDLASDPYFKMGDIPQYYASNIFRFSWGTALPIAIHMLWGKHRGRDDPDSTSDPSPQDPYGVGKVPDWDALSSGTHLIRSETNCRIAEKVE